MLHLTELTQETLDAIKHDDALAIKLHQRTGFHITSTTRWLRTGYQKKLNKPQMLEVIAQHLGVPVEKLLKKVKPNTIAA